MTSNILKRLEIVEKAMDISGIPEKERILVIPFYTEDDLVKAEEQAIERLKQKYGADVSTDDLLIVTIRKFAPEGTDGGENGKSKRSFGQD